jgi:hypothetical protein
MLEKKIKKTLIETKEKKERLLIEQKIVKDRVSILFEGINSEEDFNKLSKKQKLNLSIKFLHEMSYLQNTGLINEQNFGNILSSLFGGWFGNAIQTFVEPVLKGILVPWFGEGYFTNFIISLLTKNTGEFIRGLNDCKIMTKLIAQSISEAVFMQIQDAKGLNSPGYVFLRQSMGDALTSTEFIKGIEKGFGNMVCDMLGKFTGNATKVAEKLKSTGSSVVPGTT